jgi:hypothetical protein
LEHFMAITAITLFPASDDALTPARSTAEAHRARVIACAYPEGMR